MVMSEAGAAGLVCGVWGQIFEVEDLGLYFSTHMLYPCWWVFPIKLIWSIRMKGEDVRFAKPGIIPFLKIPNPLSGTYYPQVPQQNIPCFAAIGNRPCWKSQGHLLGSWMHVRHRSWLFGSSCNTSPLVLDQLFFTPQN
ncbi:unnamed protein product [Durusdinium trenchii]|uniref:Uncharacterized protein n=1 Tax=Durusdinium trenchii TaxID=1381693 RepID=A0ABP0IFH4_9DINO